MKRLLISVWTGLVLCCCIAHAQTNIISTSAAAFDVLRSAYNPADYQPVAPLSDPDLITRGINSLVSPDSLRGYLETLAGFYNRNTGSDTASPVKGIGAARRWVYAKFQQYAQSNPNRLIPGYLQFDMDICGIKQHRNIFAVLPGWDTTQKGIVLVEGHMDSRCAVLCDTACLAQGMEDNGSGTALVLELARVLSRYSFRRTVVFMVTIGEEQSLAGATAFATWAKQQNIQIHAVLNNDIVGGVLCGKTASAPACPTPGGIDSTQVRIFSYGGFNSPHKSLARFVKLEYKEQLLRYVQVPMLISVMSAEDRTGRGGDHIPFRQNNYTAVRFTSANEHGDASNGPTYTDRQHTSRDILGADANGDNKLDTFYVDFNYLARNCVINGVGLAMAALGPAIPDFDLTAPAPGKLAVRITKPYGSGTYRVGVRTRSNDFDTVYTFQGKSDDTITVDASATYSLSVAAVDSNGVESLFSREVFQVVSGTPDAPNQPESGVHLMGNKPNPFDEATIISVWVGQSSPRGKAIIRVTDPSGRRVADLPISLRPGVNDTLYRHGYNANGVYYYSLVIDGRIIETKAMIFAN